MDAKKTPSRKEATASTDAKKRPVNVIRIEDVSGSIFRFDRADGSPNFSCNFQRSYKDSTGSWQRTQWFPLEDLGKLAQCVQQAQAWITGQLEGKEA